MVAALAASGFERTQNPLDTRRRVRRALDVEWFVVCAERKFLRVRISDPRYLTRPLISVSGSFAFRFVPKCDRKPVPRIDAHHSEVEIDEFLLGENANGFRVDLVWQVMHRD
jgi:hypothetical protein